MNIEELPNGITLERIQKEIEQNGYFLLPAGATVRTNIVRKVENKLFNTLNSDVETITDVVLPRDTMFEWRGISYEGLSHKKMTVYLLPTSEELIEFKENHHDWKETLIQEGKLSRIEDGINTYERFSDNALKEEHKDNRAKEKIKWLELKAETNFLEEIGYLCPDIENVSGVSVYINKIRES